MPNSERCKECFRVADCMLMITTRFYCVGPYSSQEDWLKTIHKEFKKDKKKRVYFSKGG